MKFKKNNKGFSLVELIIVIAIMVALVAVLAPQFSKYVQNARDSVVASAAADVETVVKAEVALGNITGGQVVVSGDTTGVKVDDSALTLSTDAGYTKADLWGSLSTKNCKSGYQYTIKVEDATTGKVSNTKDAVTTTPPSTNPETNPDT